LVPILSLDESLHPSPSLTRYFNIGDQRVFTRPYMDTARFAKVIFDVTLRHGTGCSLISGLMMQAEACGGP
jgi:hypothetical protein